MTDPAGDAGPIFIVGMDRSGTTLMSALLSAHPRIAIAPETWFASHFAAPARNLDLSNPENLRAFLDRYAAHEYFPHLGLDRASLDARIHALPRPTFGSVFEAILQAYAQQYGKPRWGEKTPHHWQHLDLIFEWFPNVRIVFMLRDPRAVFASFRKAPFGHEWTDAHARLWRDCAANLLRRSGDPRVRPIRYESLVADPETELRSLCEFLGEAFHPAMLAREGDAYRLDCYEGWRLGHERKAAGPISEASVDAWRSELSDYKLAVIEHCAGRMMDALGYARAAGPLGPRRWARMQLGRARRNLRYHFQKLAGAPPRPAREEAAS